MDGSGALRGFGADGDGPGAALVLPGGEEADEAQQLVALANEPHQAAFVQAVAREKLRCFLFVHVGQLCFHFAANRGGSSAGPARHFLQLEAADGRFKVVTQCGAFADIQRIQNRLLRQEHEALDKLLLVGRHLQFAQRLLLFQRLFRAQQQGLFAFQLAGAALLQILFHAFQTFFDLRKVADHQVEFNVLDVAQRVDGPYMGNGVVFERAQYVDERIDVAQAGEERGLLQRLLPNGGHVDVLHGGEGGLLRRVERGQLVKPLIGHAGHPDVRLARVGVAPLLELGLGQNLEQRCLAHLRQADNASFHVLPEGPQHDAMRAYGPLR